MLEHPRSSPPIACPTRSRTEEHPCWLGRGTPPQSERIHLWWQSSILDHLVRCYQLGCSACLARRSSQIRICSCARHRYIPYKRPARAPRNQCQSIWAFSVWTTKTRWFLGHREAGWGKGSCYDIIEMVVSYSSAWCSSTDKTVTAKWIDFWPTVSLMRNTNLLLLLFTYGIYVPKGV